MSIQGLWLVENNDQVWKVLNFDQGHYHCVNLEGETNTFRERLEGSIQIMYRFVFEMPREESPAFGYRCKPDYISGTGIPPATPEPSSEVELLKKSYSPKRGDDPYTE